ncbi:hypothetical protein RB2342 [Rhodopirellula baltica SH 1]|uniref:Uncharacterized protein n=1 Tax=Rhodopirellula baltica (strain DSM 10527 / NCIMB 13988 / SH1) TaxID=243090 RepID=Q7UW03_RHOBA|nr:hypothetical protein RB2342 [Rhodopirellula baltica SH 1]
MISSRIHCKSMPEQREVSRGHSSDPPNPTATRRPEGNERARIGSSRGAAVAVWQTLSAEAVGPMAWGIAATR